MLMKCGNLGVQIQRSQSRIVLVISNSLWEYVLCYTKTFDFTRLQERERLMQIRSSLIREQELAKEMKLQKQKDKQLKLEERLGLLVSQKKEARRLRMIKSKAREETIRQKLRAAANSAQQKIIHTMLEWREKERVRKKITETRLLEEKEQKCKLVEQKYVREWQDTLR